jgi:hypothetical protein
MAQQYKPGDYYITDSSNVRVYVGDNIWTEGGIVGTPGANNAIQNGRKVQPPAAQGAAPGTPNSELGNSPAAQQAQAQATSGAAPAPKTLTYTLNTPTKPSDTSLRYPGDIGEATDYMIFEFFKYKPPFGKGSGAGAANPTREAYNQTSQLKDKAGLPQIILYMPEDVSASYKADWAGKRFSNVGAGILASAGGVAGGDFKGALDKIAGTAGAAVKKLPAQLGAFAVSSIVGSITGESISSNDIFSSIGGQILNPNTELIFGGHEFRSFTFVYKLVAYNQAEVRSIQNIIKTFKIAMLPSFSEDRLKYADQFAAPEFGQAVPTLSADVNDKIGFIKNPLLVQPYFMTNTGINGYLPRFKPCVISDIDVNYTADGAYATYGDGSPVAMTLTVSLQETKLVYEEDIRAGF